MPNIRNAQALEKLVEDFRQRLGRFDSPRYFAEWLASNGVLVPSTLTPEQLVKIGQTLKLELAGSGLEDPEAHAACRDLLERIAKGKG
jgi:hypothetical protein